ncbi:MAG TPA: FKBP-type peptidyl-prolyl cis-trans isomerase [Pyrinomonadaceae bacterium]|nr:FKBP-type peptidyl-prolyl cis-trans isomerase [Pyrinomonadaceae bacterium]
MRKLKSSVVIAALLVAACASVGYGQTRRRAPRKPARAAAAAKAKAPCAPSEARTTASGLTYVVTRHGTGQQLKAGDEVLVHYTGLLTNGTKFDSSLDRGEPIGFPLGAGRVIKGWDEGVALLRVGDQATLIIPPQIGYGSRGAGGGAIPPDATLVFIVEVVGVQQAGAAPDR